MIINTFLTRTRLHHCQQWLNDPQRKPLVLRGARQVGKTSLIRQLAYVSNRQLLELNFEHQPILASLFESNDVQRIKLALETKFNQNIDPRTHILFLDEIQAAPELIAKLRWFAEEYQQLPVIAVGSLLDFTLAEHKFSMPVGRIQYLHLEPLSFSEFLLAQQKQKLYDFISSYEMQEQIPQAIHQELLELFAEYMIIGGLPASVVSWTETRSINKVSQIHHDLLATYRDDFSKYADRTPIIRLEEILQAVPKMLGRKFVYSQVNPNRQSNSIKHALNLLIKARLCHSVTSTAANGIPLGAEINNKLFKIIFIDVGLTATALGLRLEHINDIQTIQQVNQGALTEQIVGQLLRTIEPYYVEPNLYYWARETSSSSAEVDYLIQHHTNIIPIEVKSGKAGSLKSLHLFMAQKKQPIAMRINSHYPEQLELNVATQIKVDANYKLLSIPFYLTEQIHRLLFPS